MADAARDGSLDASGRVVLRFTWDDVVRRSGRVAETVRAHLDLADPVVSGPKSHLGV
jgi:very-short-patch-repair endonuclease